MRPLSVLAALCLFASLSPLQAAPAVAAPPAASRSSSQVKVREAIFAHLEKQAEAKSELPDFPAEKLLLWIDGRNAAVPEEPKARYTLLFQHLLIAQSLLKSDKLAARKDGFWIASESANFTAAKLPQDQWLLSRIYEGFLLPYASLANAQIWQDPSRQRIIESAVSAFAHSNERSKQISVLEWLLSIGDRQKAAKPKAANSDSLVVDANTLDWARGTLASVLFASPDATRAEIERSLALLESIESPDMSGFQHLKGQVQARLDQLQTTTEANG